MDIVLVRHTSVGVPKGTCYGWSDVPVAETFEAEAAETKRNLGAEAFDAVFSSPLTRARKLAEYCGWPSPIVDDRLKEMNMGDWEMKLFDEIEDENLQKWYDDYMHLAATGGESFPVLFARVAVFAHGGVLICAGIYGGLFPAEDCFKHLVPYGGIEKITI